MSETLALLYENHRGETRVRSVEPLGFHWGSSTWHPEPQWLMAVFDHEKKDYRDFAVSGIRSQAQAARIAELESQAHRARIAREFYDEVFKDYRDQRPTATYYEAVDNVLARWEAAAKEGK